MTTKLTPNTLLRLNKQIVSHKSTYMFETKETIILNNKKETSYFGLQ